MLPRKRAGPDAKLVSHRRVPHRVGGVGRARFAGETAYTANYGSKSVSVIDTATNTVTATIAVGSRPYGVAVSPDGTTAYIANQDSYSVSVIHICGG